MARRLDAAFVIANASSFFRYGVAIKKSGVKPPQST
jgi:hypothetical protein